MQFEDGKPFTPTFWGRQRCKEGYSGFGIDRMRRHEEGDKKRSQEKISDILYPQSVWKKSIEKNKHTEQDLNQTNSKRLCRRPYFHCIIWFCLNSPSSFLIASFQMASSRRRGLLTHNTWFTYTFNLSLPPSLCQHTTIFVQLDMNKAYRRTSTKHFQYIHLSTERCVLPTPVGRF